MKSWRPKLTAVNDPIADDYWSYRTEDGVKRTSRVTIGRPALLADGTNWYCPMYFEHVTRGIDYAMGVGPVDALMNAMYFVRRRFYEFEDVTPRAKPATAPKRPQAKKRQAAGKKPAKANSARRSLEQRR